MIKIDLKDKKILFHLSEDSRQSLKSIGKKAGISKELAAYRIKRLRKNRIIKNYSIFTNVEKFGYVLIFIFYNFTKINPIIKNKIINFFIENKYTSYVSTIEGNFDFQVNYMMGNPFEYESLMDTVQKKYHKYLKFKFATTYIRGEEYNYPFLLDEKINITKPRNYSWGEYISPIDELDFKILVKLSKNPREQTKVIANNLKSTVSIVSYRIKKMIKENIILRYSINVDWLKLGYRYFHLRISLGDYDKKKFILNHLRKNPYLIRISKDLIYSIDIHCTFLLQNMEQLREIVENLTLNFPDEIDKCEFFSTYKVYKDTILIPKLLDVKNPLKK